MGAEFELKDPTRDGFIFQGWYTDSEYMTKVNNTSEFTDDVVLYAKWKSNKCEFSGNMISH
ncbi:InlB B-repeat-containing protein [bacterium]|nr:InlB B-repeat-containing protein [bacterium]